MLEERGFGVAVEDLVVIPGAEGEGVYVYMVYASRDGVVADDRPVARPIRPAADLGPAGLREFLAAHLPEHMVPSDFVLLDALPLTPNGKVDRRALPAPRGRRLATAIDFVAPRSRMESDLAEQWKAVLGVERVGVGDNFFELGGTSLLIAQLRTRLRGSLGVEVTLVDLFRHPTVESLARRLTAEGDAEGEAERRLDDARSRGRRMKDAMRGKRGRPAAEVEA
jgi:aryl carrier-like protein